MKFINFLLKTLFVVFSLAPLSHADKLACYQIYTNTSNIDLEILRSGKIDLGYNKEVFEFDEKNTHTIKQINEYIKDNMGSQLSEWIQNGKKVLILEGDGEEVKNQLLNSGWKILGRVYHKVGFHDIIKIKKNDEELMAILRVNGNDRVLHIQSFLKLMGASSEQVLTSRGYRSWKNEYKEVFRELKKAPDLVVYGLTHHATTVLGTMSSGFFNKLEWMAIKAKMALDDFTEQSNSSKIYADISFRPMRVVTLSNGKTVWLISPLYGEMVKDLISALAEVGTKNILFLGTAGAIDPLYKVGDWVDPATINHTHVATPNFENKKWLENEIQKNTQVVDVEYAHAIAEVKKHSQLRFESRLLISDVLRGINHTDLHATSAVGAIDGIFSGLRKALTEKMLDLGMEDGKFRWVKSYYFARKIDKKEMESIALSTAKKLGFVQIGAGVFDKINVVSGRVGPQFLSAKTDEIRKDFIRFYGKVVTGPRGHNIGANNMLYSHSVMVKTSTDPKDQIERLLTIARKFDVGEVAIEVNPNSPETIRFIGYFNFASSVREFADTAKKQMSGILKTTKFNEKSKQSIEERIQSLEDLRSQLNSLRRKLPPPQPKFPSNRKLPPFSDQLALQIHQALTDPNFFIDFMIRVEREAFALNKDPKTDDYLHVIVNKLNKLGFTDITEIDRFLSKKEFLDILQAGNAFNDFGLKNKAHGEFTHIFHFAMLSDLLLNTGVPNVGPELMKAISKDKKMPLWATLFDSLEEHPLNLSNPEVLATYLRIYFNIE